MEKNMALNFLFRKSDIEKLIGNNSTQGKTENVPKFLMSQINSEYSKLHGDGIEKDFES